jgi:hypothetical protein
VSLVWLRVSISFIGLEFSEMNPKNFSGIQAKKSVCIHGKTGRFENEKKQAIECL